MLPGYNTNGFAHHRLEDALHILADLGYKAVGLTLDVHHLDPFHSTPADIFRIRDLLQKLKLTCVVETGARFLLDARRKHQPTLMNPKEDDRVKRRGFLETCMRIAKELDAPAVSFWSGAADTEPDNVLMKRLVDECRRVADCAGKHNRMVAFEPEPGMFIDTMPKFAALHDRVFHPHFGLTLDVGHLVCLGELPISSHLLRWKDWLHNIHVEDMKAGVHDHLMFGEGDVDFADLAAGLKAIDYKHTMQVELSRHSHDAVRTADKAMKFLHNLR